MTDTLALIASGELTLAQIEGMTASDAYALADFGWKLLEMARPDAATLVFEALAFGNPRHSYFHALHGVALQRSGKSDLALEAYARALAINPDEPAALVNRAEILLGLPDPPQDEIAELLDRAISLDPDRVLPETKRAWGLAQSHKEP